MAHLITESHASAEDEKWMALAFSEAEKGRYTASPNPRVGCVLVNPQGLCIGKGFHAKAGQNHAEIEALADADRQHHSVVDATAYVTLEPCAHWGRTGPCADALIKAQVKRVVTAMADPDPRVAGRGIERLKAAGIEVTGGVLSEWGQKLNRGFISRILRHRPWVRSKFGTTLDGKTALNNGLSQWITGEPARHDNQHYRAQSDAILTGIQTVLVDNPRLTVRDISLDKQPLRVVVDSQFRFPLEANMLDGSPLLIVTGVENHSKSALLAEHQAETILLPLKAGHVDLAALMDKLAQRGINEVQVEAGAQLNGALLQNDLVDELLIYYAAKIMGSRARGMFDLPPFETLAHLPEWEIESLERVGHDIRLSGVLIR